MDNEKMTFAVVDDDGKETECEVLFTLGNDETGKNYIVYTDNTLDDDGYTKVYASIYEPGTDFSALQPIETEEEWEMVETILEELQEEALDHE